MDELVQLLAGKFNLPEENARSIIATVIGFIKTRLPEPFANQLEGLLAGQVSAANLTKDSGGTDLLGRIGNLVGKK